MRGVWVCALALCAACGDDEPAADAGRPPDAGAEVDAGDDVDAAAPGGGPARYRDDELRSPVTASVVARMREVRAQATGGSDDVFMKVGASGTVTTSFLHCFAGADVDLDGRDVLQPAIDHYDAPSAAGGPSWSRDSLAAEVGRSASWSISGSPSPVEQEIAAISPSVALVNYGTNDMQLGTTYETALWPFYANFTALLDQLEAEGIVPIITGLNPRSDLEGAAQWVTTYNAVTRAEAEARQLPYINLYRASVDLPDMGLLSDGIHGNAYSLPCAFTAEGLQYNYNVRNLLTLEALHDLRSTVLLGEPAPDADTAGYAGTGAPTDPFVVDGLPFTHRADTAASPHSSIDGYPACDSGQNESGPELYYRLDLSEATPVRIVVLDRGDVDVDVHLLQGDASAGACVARDHRIIETTLAPGTYYVVVDSFVGVGGVHAGAYSLVVVACEPGDSRCT